MREAASKTIGQDCVNARSDADAFRTGPTHQRADSKEQWLIARSWRLSLVLVCAALTGCGYMPPPDIRPIGPAGEIVPSSHPCGCVGAKSWAIHNRDDNDAAQITYIKYTRPRGNTSPFVPERHSVSLGPGARPSGSAWIGCQYEPDPPNTSACNTEVTFGVPDAVLYARTQQQMYRALARQSDSRLYCLDICPIDHPFSNCLQAKKGSSFARDFGAKLTRLHSQLMDPNTVRIAPKELLDLFELKSDACSRGDTSISGDTISNEGPAECKIEVTLRLPGRRVEAGQFIETVSDEKVELRLPRKANAQLARLKDINTAMLSYAQPVNAPQLIFPGHLDETYGGTVRSFIAQPKRMLFETLNGCTDIPLE